MIVLEKYITGTCSGVIAILLLCLSPSYGQTAIGDLTISYKVSAEGSKVDTNILKAASKTFYVSGSLTRTDIQFGSFRQSTIYNQNGGKAYVLYDVDGDRYMTVLDADEWKKQYEKYRGLKLKPQHQTKTIAGYSCKKTIATLKDGTNIELYYTSALKPTAPENPYEFDDINGLVLEYQAVVQNGLKITYTATGIDFNPVPAAEFIIPKEGYRLLNN